jgi:hypothetical protein
VLHVSKSGGIQLLLMLAAESDEALVVLAQTRELAL